MRFGILGPIEVWTDDEMPVPIHAPMRRTLLAALLVRAGRPSTPDQLLDALWGDEPPAAALESLHAQVSRLRHEIGRDRLETSPAGYRIPLAEAELDARQFEILLAAARSAMAAHRWSEAVEALDAALGLWRGAALEEFADRPFAQAEHSRLEELRHGAIEDRLDARLALGLGATLLPELDALVTEEPLRERLRGQQMLALYRAGRQADALAAYRRLRVLLRDELGLDPSPPIDELQKQILRQDPALQGGPQRQAPVLLPSPLTPLIGRRDLLERSIEGLRQGRLVTLVGPGGVGKTRLSLAIGEALVPTQSGGVVFVDLAAVRDPKAVISRIGDLVGGGDRPGDVIGNAHMLVVLDNLEQVIASAGDIVRLLEQCRNLRVLATSRAPLHVRGEILVDVPPLPQDEASQLFVDRATATMASVELDPGIVSDIVARLDCLPLAIELAAARTRLLAPGLVRERLADRLGLLIGGMRDAPARQQTLRDTIEWSYRLLEPAAQGALRSLAVFLGDFSVDAAAAVAGTSMERIGDLVDQSLVHRVGERLAMLETIREFAVEEAVRLDEVAAARSRHLAFFRPLPLASLEGTKYAKPPAWFAACSVERQNLRLALEWAVAEGDHDALIDIFRGAGVYWLFVGALAEGWRWSQLAIDAVRGRADDVALSVLSTASQYPASLGDLRTAFELKSAAFDIAMGLGQLDRAALMVDDMAWVRAADGAYGEARLLLERADELHAAEADCDATHRSHTIVTTIEVELRSGRTAEAVASLERLEALEPFSEQWPDRVVEIDSIRAQVHLAAGDEATAKRLFERNVPMSIELGIPWLAAGSLEGLAAIESLRDPRRAAALLGMADRVWADSGNPIWLAAQREATIARIDGALSADVVEAIRAQGRALTLPAIADAVSSSIQIPVEAAR